MNVPRSHQPNLLPADTVYPLAYGNEEETGLLDNFTGEMDEPYHLTSDLLNRLPSDLDYAENNHLLYLQNGSKLYPGGTEHRDEGLTNIERATPECATPSQLTLYMRASEQLLVNLVGIHLVEASDNQPGEQVARIQRRVVDSYGNRKGCHDNFGYSRDSPLAEFDRVPPSMLSHLASRSFVSGAGYISDDGTFFAQKIGGLERVKWYSNSGSMYRIATTDGTPRLEIRCSDINISDWAACVRIGSTAISLALNQTALGSRLQGMTETEALIMADYMNYVQVNADGQVADSVDLRQAVGFQQAQMDLALSKLHMYAEDMPTELVEIAKEVYEFCDDFKRVLSGDKTVATLADRADWAAKFNLNTQRMYRDVQRGIPRSFTDISSQALDLHYDYIGLRARDCKLYGPEWGLGYKLRAKVRFKGVNYSPKQINHAYYSPPTETRAAIRSHLIKNYYVAGCTWHSVTLHDEFEKQTFHMHDVTQNRLSASDKQRLGEIKQKP